MRKLHFGIDLATLAGFVREVELHRSDGWAKGVPIVTGDGTVIVTGANLLVAQRAEEHEDAAADRR